MKEKKVPIWSKVPSWAWALISLALAVALWLAASGTWPAVFASPEKVLAAFLERAESGLLWEHVWASVSRVLTGFGIAFVVSIPVAFLMAWYDPFRHVVEPWIQFIRNIPPLAYVFLIIAALGIGQTSKITVIFIAAFLVMVITIYQGVKGVDVTLIKAARVLGATQKDIFFKVTIPATTPFILAHHAHGVRDRRRRQGHRHDDPAGERLLPDGRRAPGHHPARHHRHLLREDRSVP